VECIEHGETNTANTKALLAQYCEPLLKAGADTIVLGCTHYPFVRELIQDIVGNNVTLIDTGAAVANHLQTTMQSQSLLASSKEVPIITIWTNNTAADREAVIQQLWGKKNTNIKVMG
jgi:glutamate racemase